MFSLCFYCDADSLLPSSRHRAGGSVHPYFELVARIFFIHPLGFIFGDEIWRLLMLSERFFFVVVFFFLRFTPC